MGQLSSKQIVIDPTYAEQTGPVMPGDSLTVAIGKLANTASSSTGGTTTSSTGASIQASAGGASLSVSASSSTSVAQSIIGSLSATTPIPVQLSFGNKAVTVKNRLPVSQSFGYVSSFSASAVWKNTTGSASPLIWSVFNSSTGTRTAYLKRLKIRYLYTGNSADDPVQLVGVSTSYFSPTGGTDVVAANKFGGNTISPALNQIKFSPTGLSSPSLMTTGGTLLSFVGGRVKGAQTVEVFDWTACADEADMIRLPSGSGLALCYLTAGTANDFFAVDVEWSER